MAAGGTCTEPVPNCRCAPSTPLAFLFIVPVSQIQYPAREAWENLNSPSGQPNALAGLHLLFPSDRFLARIGGGAYGEIWLAVSANGQYRAIKYVAKDGPGDETRHGREHRGIQLLQTLQNIPSGIVPILEVREDPQTGFGYAMALADPERPLWQEHPEEYRPKTLRGELVARRALPLAECLDIGIRLAEALDFLQRHRLVHRDIKPSNVIYIQGQPVLADIGLLVDTREAESIVGTPGYVPSEQHGHFSGDIYSLGILLAEISTGRPADETGFSPVEEADTDAPDYARWLEILARATDSNPAKRHQTAAVLLRDLQELKKNPRNPHQRRSRLWLGLALGLAVALTAWFATLQSIPPTVPFPPLASAPSQWETVQKELERKIETGQLPPPVIPPGVNPSSRTHFTIPDNAAQNGVFLNTYSDRILVGRGSAENIADWRLAMTYHPIGTRTQALFLFPLALPDPSRQPVEPPLRIWPSNTANNAQTDGLVLIPPAILANHPPHNYPRWIFLTTNAPEKWEAWMADNAAILTNATEAFYRFQQEWYRQYRFAFEAPSGNPAYDKALEQLKVIIGKELRQREEP